MQHTESNGIDPRSNVYCPHPSHLDSDSISLLDLLHVIAKRSRMIFLITFATALISAVYSFFLPNVYTARTLILPAQEDKGMMSAMMAQLGGLANLAGGAVGAPTTTDLYITMLKSEAVMDPIIERFRLKEVYKAGFNADVYRRLESDVVITTGKKDGLITVAVSDRDPKRAADMANAYVEELGNLAIRLNVSGAGRNRSFLEERLTKARADLAKAEENLKAFQSRNKAVDMPAQAEATIRGVAEMRAQLAAQEVQLATYRRQFTESSQEVKTLATSVANLKAQIARLEGGGGNSSIPSVGSVPALEQEYVRLKREFKIQETLVELLAKQYEMARLSESKDISPFHVIHKATVPEKKSKPKRSVLVLVATITTFSFSVFLAFLCEYFERISDHDRVQLREMKKELLFWK